MKKLGQKGIVFIALLFWILFGGGSMVVLIDDICDLLPNEEVTVQTDDRNEQG